MKTNILFGLSTFFIALLLLSFVSAECTEYGTFKQGSSINLINTCTLCSDINASITYPDSTSTGLIQFQNIDGIYNYTFSDTSQLGTYNVIGKDAWCYSFEVTNSGSSQTTAQGLGSIAFIFLIFGLMILFGFIGWKLLNNDLLWAGGTLLIGLSMMMLVYSVWLTYEFKLNYTGSSPDALVPQIIFYIFMTILMIGVGVTGILLFTKWRVIKEKFKNAIKPEQEDKDDLI